jgi:hypothetical protein
MMFESNYRRKAMDSWESDRAEMKKEWNQMLTEKKHVARNPVVIFFASIAAYFTQQ